MPALTPRKLLIIDGHAYAYRAFYAIRQLTSPAGQPTNAIYGFISMLGKMQTQLQPTHLAVIWDGGLAAERLEALPEYKSQRPPMPDDLASQIEAIQEYLAAAKVASWCGEGVEADDWIATLARRAAAAEYSVVIASADKDFLQLVGPRIGLLNPHDKSEKVWTADDVRAKTGVAPEQVVDWLSLVGDSVDNIPGVPGVGPKTAAGLLQQFGSLDALAPRCAEVRSAKLRAQLQSSLATLKRNQELIRLHDNLDLPAGLDELQTRAPDCSRLKSLYATWGFQRLLAQLNETPSLF